MFLAGAPRGIEPPRARREIILLRRRPDASRDAFDAAIRAVAEALVDGRRVLRVVLDRPVAGGPGLGNIQAEGILQVWPLGIDPVIRELVDANSESFGWVATEAYETPPKQLQSAP